jgi:plastocyanin
MSKILVAVVVGAVFVLGAVGLVTSNNNTSNESTSSVLQQDDRSEDESQQQMAGTNEVSIDNFAFTPEKLVVTVGTKIKWTNNDTARHNIDFLNDDMEDSDLLSQGEIYEYTFNKVGVFEYICTPHPYMTASVEVVEE